MSTFGKLGTVCIITDGLKVNGKGERSYPASKQYTIGRVTKATLQKPNGYKLLSDKVKSNLDHLYNCLQWIGSQPESLRLFRIGSDLLPWFDSEEFNHMYDDKLLFVIDHKLAKCKKLIDDKQIRIATHPDKKAAILNSDNPLVRANAVRNLNYHGYFMQRLQSHKDGAVINIHMHGKITDRVVPEWDQLSDYVKQVLTFENDDVITRAGVQGTLNMCELYGVRYLYDTHHDWAENSGEGWIDLNGDTFRRILATWGDVRPMFHVSDSRDPEGDTPKKISPHSEYITSNHVIQRTSDLLLVGDVECEVKSKNLGVCDLHHKIQQLENNY